MSAWKKPSRKAWRRNVWITARARCLRSKPLASSLARSCSGVPSIQSSVSTSLAVRSQSTAGTRKSGSRLVFSAISDSAAASNRRSISIQTERRSVATVSIRRSRRASADSASARRAANVKASRSTRKRCSMLGRSTLTATGLRPAGVSISARCTCAIEAAATAGPKSANASPSGLPSAAVTTASASWRGNGAILSCRLSRSRARAMPTTSGRVARNWPSFTYVGPSLVNAAARRLPAPALVGRSISRANFSPVRAGSGSAFGSTSANTPSRASTKPARARRVRWATAEIIVQRRTLILSRRPERPSLRELPRPSRRSRALRRVRGE